MNWYKISQFVFSDIHSKEDLTNMLKNPQTLNAIVQQVENINKEEYGKRLGTSNPTLLYHGSPQTKLEQLLPVKGRRSHGFMGAEYQVDNQGVFLTDSKQVATYFGKNRSDSGEYGVYQAYVNLDKVLDIANLPSNIRSLGLKMVNAYDGTRKTRFARSDMWWLLDKSEFINAIKSLGFNSVRFRESIAIEKSAGNGNTYLVFNPKDIAIKSKQNDVIKDFDSLWNYINQGKTEQPQEQHELV